MEQRCPSSAGHGAPSRTADCSRLGIARLLVVSVGLATLLAGCVRPYYRKKADEEVADIYREKDKYPDWKLESSHVYPDPRARFADLSHPDYPPMPPDDPAAADLSPTPQKPGKSGVALMESTGYLDMMAAWDAENRAAEAAKQEQEKKEAGNGAARQEEGKKEGGNGAASPGTTPEKSPSYGTSGTTSDQSEFPDPLDTTKGPRPFRMTLDQAVELGVINSREFQDRREDLYLQALPVTAERFAFSSQFFATEQLIRERLGKFFPGGPANRWVSNSTLGFTKLFSTGALLMLQFANNTVIELANPTRRHTISQSTIDLDIVQPLLRGGGRAVTLEPLTLAERNLLYEIRDYAHFRKQFYVNIAAGIDVGGISVGTTRFRNRPLGFFNGVGLIFGAQLKPGSGFAFGVPASGNATPSGFLPTLLNAAQLVIEQENVRQLERYLRLFRGYEEGGDISALQVQLVESQLLQGRNFLFTENQQLLDTLDRLKLQLGIPVNIPLELDDSPVEPQSRQMGRFRRIINEFETLREAANRPETIGAPGTLRRRLRELATTSPLVRGTRFRTEFPRRWAAWERRSNAELEQRLTQFREELRRLLASRAQLEAQGQPVPQTLEKRIEEVGGEIALALFEKNLRVFEALPPVSVATVATAGAVPGGAAMLSALTALSVRTLRPADATQLAVFREILNLFEQLMLEARNERVAQAHELWAPVPRLCLNGIDLLTVDLDQAETAVVQAALTNRFELMNT
ncbi:MAG TPA: hypothetical protein VKD72_13700, partial [Gemmataceae bacterium]|nr:hypothetical protein [Gemmataceae bacterium]